MRSDESSDYVAEDHRLEAAHEKSIEQLARHRWHWTLDESNPDRVSLSEYARRVSRRLSTVQKMAHGYAAWTGDRGSAVGGPVTLGDFIEQAHLGAEKAEATEAVAAATGKSFSTVARGQRTEVKTVLDTARDRAERKGTSVSDEIPKVADWREKSRQARQSELDHKRATRYVLVELEGHLGAALRRLREALKLAREVDFDSEETELISDSIEKLKTSIALLDVRVTGETMVDWDSEFARVVEEGS